jgi:hypothetical protein
LKAYRGTRWKTRKSKAKIGRIALPERDGDAQSVVDGGEGERLMALDVDLENGEAMPGLKGWCERYCNDPASVKSCVPRCPSSTTTLHTDPIQTDSPTAATCTASTSNQCANRSQTTSGPPATKAT